MKVQSKKEVQPIIKRLEDFDESTGLLPERILFNNRAVVMVVCALITIILGYYTTQLGLNANFEKTIPTSHPYIVNYLERKIDLSGLGNAVRLAVEVTDGTIYDADYLEILRQVTDETFLLPGVDRMKSKSIWSPGTRWMAVTEVGFEGGPVIPAGYDGSPKSLDQIRRNIERSGTIGSLVAMNHKSSIVFLPLMSEDPKTGGPIDYGAFSEKLEQIRAKYQSDKIKIHITGFAKVMGDLIEGVQQIMLFFILAVLIATAVLYWYTRATVTTIVVVACSLVAVIWQLGLSALLGFELDPYSVLVPFLIFAIAMSHGAQKMNGILQDIGRGTHKVIAARYTFRRLFLAGLTALLSDAVGFAILSIIDIGAIRDLALIASIGVAVIIFTNLILVPITLSYTGSSQSAAARSLAAEEAGRRGDVQNPVYKFFELFTQRKYAYIAIAMGIVLAVVGYQISLDLRIGDLDPGAPELRPDSRYNKDNAFMVANYGASSDVLAVMVSTPEGLCNQYDTLMKTDALEWRLRQLPGVDSSNSIALLNRRVTTGLTEGSPKWYELLNSQSMLNFVANNVGRGMYNDTCSMITLYVYLKDHRADTLSSVVNLVEEFAAENDSEEVQFLLAAGSAGIEAATNIVVKDANRKMLFYVYAAVIVLCFITFRSWRGVVCAVLPLMLTSILAE
ncbi:MAG: MMPL family transporter, partial [Desulfobacteraceae bacterium]